MPAPQQHDPRALPHVMPGLQHIMPALQHIMIVGGTLVEWGALPEDRWAERVWSLGEAAGGAGARWLTLRPFERGPAAETAHPCSTASSSTGAAPSSSTHTPMAVIA
jgi:hypothetical protein